MIEENSIYDIYDRFGIEDNEVLIENFKIIIRDECCSNAIKSKAYCGIGDVICFLEPALSDDAGYKYYKKALEYDEENIDARVGICIIFGDYPAPENEILTEKEYLEQLQILINKFDKIEDQKRKDNIIQLMKSLIEYRLKQE